MGTRAIGAIAGIVAVSAVAGCSDPDGTPSGTSLFNEMDVLTGSGLLGPVIHYPSGEGDAFAHEAYIEVFGDPTDVWLAYQAQLAQSYGVDAPTGLEACSTGSSGRATCSLDGYASKDDTTLFVRMRMWQPRQDFAGRYVVKIEVEPHSSADTTDEVGSVQPSHDDTEPIDSIPAPRAANASPPSTGEQIGNGTLNDAYSLPLPDGVSVVRNLESGLGVDGISAYLKVEDGVDAVAVAEEVADRLCEFEAPVTWEYDDLAYTFIECEGYAGDNPGSFYIIETAEIGTYFYFTVYID